MRAIDGDELIEKMYPFVSFGSVDYSELKRIVKSMPTIQPSPHWIPVTERLPKDDTVVLVCGKSGGVYTAIHNNSKTWIRGWWKMNSKNHHCNPIAWMPLPEAYKPKEGDGMSGFYFAYRLTDEIGLSFVFVYIPKKRGIQISLMFGCLMLAIGYNGREVTE